MTDSNGFTRRASYGPTSPTVGTRGARTRQQIVDAALACFVENGFHATAVEDIATRAETSRATLYQYFESKETIFVELMHVSGAAFVRVMRRLGPLGPTAEGLDNLHWWLGEWAWVFDRFAPICIEWTNVSSPKAPLRGKLVQFVEFHTEHFGRALETAGHPEDGRSTAAILVLAVMDRVHYIRHVYRPGLTDEQLLVSLALALQVYLFPTTPADVLATGPRSAAGTPRTGPARPPMPDIGPLATLPPRDSVHVPDRLAGLSPQAARTARQLLDAAGRVFAATGYEVANIDQIVGEAGLARGTFYRYFDDKLQVIVALAAEAAGEMCPLFDEFPRFADGQDPAGLRTWFHRFLDVQRRYTGVMRAWTEGFPIEAALLLPAADVVRAMSHAITASFGPARPYPLDRRAAGMLLAGLLEHFPNEGAGSSVEPTTDEVIEAQAQFVERVLFGLH